MQIKDTHLLIDELKESLLAVISRVSQKTIEEANLKLKYRSQTKKSMEFLKADLPYKNDLFSK